MRLNDFIEVLDDVRNNYGDIKVKGYSLGFMGTVYTKEIDLLLHQDYGQSIIKVDEEFEKIGEPILLIEFVDEKEGD